MSALIAQADQIVVAVRSDPKIAVSTDASFNGDASLVRCICRTDVGVGDINGLCVINATSTRARKSSS